MFHGAQELRWILRLLIPAYVFQCGDADNKVVALFWIEVDNISVHYPIRALILIHNIVVMRIVVPKHIAHFQHTFFWMFAYLRHCNRDLDSALIAIGKVVVSKEVFVGSALKREGSSPLQRPVIG